LPAWPFYDLLAVHSWVVFYERPVAVPEKIIGLALFLDFFDRCHSLASLHLPLAALGSLPPNGLVTFAPKVQIKVLPPSSWRQASVHWTLAFSFSSPYRGA